MTCVCYKQDDRQAKQNFVADHFCTLNKLFVVQAVYFKMLGCQCYHAMHAINNFVCFNSVFHSVVARNSR
jgi:hypothetical protein